MKARRAAMPPIARVSRAPLTSDCFAILALFAPIMMKARAVRIAEYVN